MTSPPSSSPAAPVEGLELAGRLAARLCHDFISPASAIVSGLDLLDDPEQQDMREEAMTLIAASARKLAALLSFSRIAFGGSAASESFDVRELQKLAEGIYEHARAELDWRMQAPAVSKPAARVLLNLALLGSAALPVGGRATVSSTSLPDGGLILALDAAGPRARLRPEAMDGLEGRQLGDGLGGQWVQAYYLRAVADQAGGTLQAETAEDSVRVKVLLPRG